MATRDRVTAASARSAFRGLNRGQRQRYLAVAGGSKDRRSNPARHRAGMAAALGGRGRNAGGGAAQRTSGS